VVVDRVVGGKSEVADRFIGTAQQRVEGKDTSYERRLDDDVSDEVDL
jgi:hypothetical protein